MSRESAIKFLSSVVEEYGKTVLHPSQETEEYLVEEIKKVSICIKYCTETAQNMYKYSTIFLQFVRILSNTSYQNT